MTPPRLYAELADWWPVMSDPEDYAEEARIYREAFEGAATRPIRTLLEIGSGGGNNASHLKAHYRLTLVDLSPGMLAMSRRLNPTCEHIQGDMRSLRLGRRFDAVMIHDAIMYMTTEADLCAALATAYEHCRPGGIALFVPDDTRETWKPHTSCGGHDRDGRSLRYLEWSLDPDPDDTWFLCVFAFFRREGEGPIVLDRDEHRLGIFPRATWLRMLGEVGFHQRTLPYRHSEFAPTPERELFVGLRGAEPENSSP